MTYDEYVEKYGADGYVKPFSASEAANPEELARQVAAGRLAAFTIPRQEEGKLMSGALMWCPHIAGYPWWFAGIAWEQAPDLPPLEDLYKNLRLSPEAAAKLPAYRVVGVGMGAQAPLIAHYLHRAYLQSYYWLTDPKVIYTARTPWDPTEGLRRKKDG
ncbi:MULTISPECIES: hypothetical protein [unclassified Meiothermus]|uniref:hypothetical protein n=1 Tax=unclassified Meiothermus TaxID=370471 RepID=UPI000D7C645E|nr:MULTISPECIES: hypothetical protein [unclassified Meiothermus]PZA06491.1 hypothetical protein DNA98_12965 [Meiothermus sp. Pnk-1]RYM36242.1 hypothetical protein EWH23_10570 [Meiothermus sp. PNK-Is4]